MTNKYRGIKEGEASWICKPNNGGDLGDVFDIADELNRLAERVATLENENEKLDKRIARLEDAGDVMSFNNNPYAVQAWEKAKNTQ